MPDKRSLLQKAKDNFYLQRMTNLSAFIPLITVTPLLA